MTASKSKYKVLVISLSNIGDIVLTLPVIDILRRDFPDAQIDLIIGPKGESLIHKSWYINQIFIYHKNQSPIKMMKWMVELAREKYDLVVDLRNTVIPFLIFSHKRTPLMISRPKGVHMRQQHLLRLQSVHPFTKEVQEPKTLYFTDSDKAVVSDLVNFSLDDFKCVVIAPGSRAHNKRWREEGFGQLADYLKEKHGFQIIFIGDDHDKPVNDRILKIMKTGALNLTGQLTLAQSAYLLSSAKLAIVNDSAPMHIASYLNIPVIAFFGPTDPAKYGPWSQESLVVRKNQFCIACASPKNKNFAHDCTLAIQYEDALAAIDPWLTKLFKTDHAQ